MIAEPMVARKTKLLAIASGGGHWVQLLRLRPAFEGCDVSMQRSGKDTGRTSMMANSGSFLIPIDGTSWPWSAVHRRLMAAPPRQARCGRLDGCGTRIMGVRFGKWLGARVIWVDSVANAEELSMSGQKAGAFVDLWLTQWPHLADRNGPQLSRERVMIFVTVGTDMPFDRLLKVVDSWAAETGRNDVFAQIGEGGWEPRHIKFANFLQPPEFVERFKSARVIVSHAGHGNHPIRPALRQADPGHAQAGQPQGAPERTPIGHGTAHDADGQRQCRVRRRGTPQPA